MKVLLIEDNVKLNEAMRIYISDYGLEIETAFNGTQGVNKIKDNKKENIFYDIVILDRLMPMGDGIEFIKEIKDLSPNIGIIMLTAKDTIEDKISGLNAGADDYMIKPFDVKELVARIHALYKRINISIPLTSGKAFHQSDILKRNTDKSLEFYFNLDSNQVFCQGMNIELTQKESKIFNLFLSRKMKVVEKDEIFKIVWNEDTADKGEDFNPRQIDVHVHNLRNKLEEIKFPGMIDTVRGVGYKLLF